MGTLLTDDTESPDFDPSIPLESMDNLSLSGTTISKKNSIFGTGNLSAFMSIVGGINSAVGTYYATKSQQYQLKSQASGLQFQADMAVINSRAAEYSAQSALEAGKTQVAQYTARAGAEKAGAVTSMAGRGIVLGQGSARDVEASMDIVKGEDVLTINSNAARAAAADRTQATNYRNQALLDTTSAQNAYASARSISPFSATFGSLLTSATSFASQWNNSQRLKMYLANGGYMPMGGFN